jgi:hypothetical protein
MPISVKRLILSGLLVGVAAAASAGPIAPAPAPGKIFLMPHRAVYDLTLARSRGGQGIDAVRGRILYDFSGNDCEGYALQFRQVSELNSLEGRSMLSDIRSTTWEDGAARKFRFNSENLTNDRRTDAVDGQAERKTEVLSVSLSKPTVKTFTEPVDAVFPTEHMRRIIEAARSGKSILEFPLYDGSETGEKLYHTLTVIGAPIPPGAAPPDDAAGKSAALAPLTRWPITISYFDHPSAGQQQTGEQTPVYSVSFELYENGISRALMLDYTDFAISGRLTSLDLKTPKSCP